MTQNGKNALNQRPLLSKTRGWRLIRKYLEIPVKIVIFFGLFLFIGLIIFSFSPKTAPVSFESSQMESIDSIRFGYGNLDLFWPESETDTSQTMDVSQKTIKINSPTLVETWIKNGTVNGTDVQTLIKDGTVDALNGDKLALYLETKEESDYIELIPKDTGAEFSLGIIGSNTETSDAEASVGEASSNGYDNSNLLEINCGDITVSCSTGFSIDTSHVTQAYYEDKSGNKIKINEISIQQVTENEENNVWFTPSEAEQNRESQRSLSVNYHGLSGSLAFNRVSHVKMGGEGKISLLFNENQDLYDLKDTTCEFSGDAQMKAKFNLQEDGNMEGTVTGTVTDAKIYNFDLFPTFYKWLIDNVFLIPGMMLSAAISVFTTTVFKRITKEKE